jgi:hypothetical protein
MAEQKSTPRGLSEVEETRGEEDRRKMGTGDLKNIN